MTIIIVNWCVDCWFESRYDFLGFPINQNWISSVIWLPFSALKRFYFIYKFFYKPLYHLLLLTIYTIYFNAENIQIYDLYVNKIDS